MSNDEDAVANKLADEIAGIKVEDFDKADNNKSKVEVYSGTDTQYYWRRRAANSQIVATGGEGYTRKDDCLDAAMRENPGLDVSESESDVPEQTSHTRPDGTY